MKNKKSNGMLYIIIAVVAIFFIFMLLNRSSEKPSGPMPKPSGPMPKPSGPMPKSSRPMPKSSRPMPKPSGPMPKPTGPMPTPSSDFEEEFSEIVKMYRNMAFLPKFQKRMMEDPKFRKEYYFWGNLCLYLLLELEGVPPMIKNVLVLKAYQKFYTFINEMDDDLRELVKIFDGEFQKMVKDQPYDSKLVADVIFKMRSILDPEESSKDKEAPSVDKEISNEELTNALVALEMNPQELDKLTISVVNKQFRKLSVKYHPDKGGDPEKFKEINNAKEILIKYLEKKNMKETFRYFSRFTTY